MIDVGLETPCTPEELVGLIGGKVTREAIYRWMADDKLPYDEVGDAGDYLVTWGHLQTVMDIELGITEYLVDIPKLPEPDQE